jgi:hypothetical protein
MTGFLLVLIHVLMSFMLFSPSVYGKFFGEDGTLTLWSGLSMLGGVLAFVVLWAYNLSFQTHLSEDKTFIRFITSRKFLLAAMTLGAAHLFLWVSKVGSILPAGIGGCRQSVWFHLLFLRSVTLSIYWVGSRTFQTRHSVKPKKMNK